MTSLFGDPKNLPLEYIHTHKQYPYAVRIVNKWLVQSGFRMDLKETSTEKSFKKYFGKKVTKLIYINQAASFNPGYRCKFLKTAKLYSQQVIRYPVRQIENLHVVDSISWLPCRYLSTLHYKWKPSLRRILSYKRLKCLEVESGWLNISLKPLRTLTNLQVLSLTIQEDRFANNYRVLPNLKGLKKLSLSIISLRTENPLTSQSEFPAFSDFLIEAKKLEQLEFLGLKLTNLFDRIGPKSRAKFFDTLSKTDIPAFSIELADLDIYCIDPEILRTCAQNIDLLELDLEKDVSVSIACAAGNIDYQHTGSAFKRLKMLFKFKSTSLYQNSLLSQNKIQAEPNFPGLETNLECQSSKCSDLASKFESLVKGCLGIPFCPPSGSNMKYLKNFSFNFARMLQIISGEIDQILLTTLENENKLEHLQLQRDTGCCYTKSNVYHCFLLISRTPTIQNLTSLHLTDFFVQENFFEILSEVFGNLKNLKVLRLDLQTKDQIDDNVPAKHLLSIPENSKLTEVYIKLPQLNENMIRDFIRLILNLHELEELTLPSGNQLIEADKNRFALLDGFKKLKKLRKVSILRGINANKDNSFPFGVRNDHRNPIVTKVRNQLKELYDFNCSLWKCCIESNEPPYQIRYKRY